MLITPFVSRVDLPTADQKNMQPFDDNALIFKNGESYAGNSVYDRAAFSWKFLQCSESVVILSVEGVLFFSHPVLHCTTNTEIEIFQ